MHLSEQKIEIFKELLNIGVGHAVATLNQMLNAPVELTVPQIKIITQSEYLKMQKENKKLFSAVEMQFDGPINGSANLIFSQQSAAQLVAAMVGDEIDSEEMNEIKSGTLSEIGNILLNAVMGSISNIIGDHFDFSIAEYLEGTFSHLIGGSFDKDKVIVITETVFYVKELKINGQIGILMALKSFEILEKAMNEMLYAE